MRHFQPFSAVIKALKESDFLEVVEDVKVRRREPLPKDFENKSQVEVQKVIEDQSMARSIYAKGFGLEQPTTQFDIEAFFTSYGSTNQVRLRRNNDGIFKGSVFVEFASEDDAKKFLEVDPRPTFKNLELLIKSKKQYCDEKVEDIREGRIPKNENHGSDSRDWKERRKDDQKNGFKDNRRGGGRGRGGHRGFGRGRGGRGGGQRHDRNDERNARNGDDSDRAEKTTAEAPAAPEASKKRDRENDGEAVEQRDAKKIVTEAT